MARDILSEYGPEIKRGSASQTGGVKSAKSLPYSHPKGPDHQNHQGPGLKGGTIHPHGSQHCHDD